MITKYSQYAQRLPPPALAHSYQGEASEQHTYTAGHPGQRDRCHLGRGGRSSAQTPRTDPMSPPHLEGQHPPFFFSVMVQIKQCMSYTGASGFAFLAEKWLGTRWSCVRCLPTPVADAAGLHWFQPLLPQGLGQGNLWVGHMR